MSILVAASAIVVSCQHCLTVRAVVVVMWWLIVLSMVNGVVRVRVGGGVSDSS